MQRLRLAFPNIANAPYRTVMPQRSAASLSRSDAILLLAHAKHCGGFSAKAALTFLRRSIAYLSPTLPMRRFVLPCLSCQGNAIADRLIALPSPHSGSPLHCVLFLCLSEARSIRALLLRCCAMPPQINPMPSRSLSAFCFAFAVPKQRGPPQCHRFESHASP